MLEIKSQHLTWGGPILHKLIVTNSNNYNVIILSSIYILLFRTGCQSNVFNTGCYFYSFCDWLVNFWLEGFSSFWIPRKLVEKKADSITFCIIPSGLYTNNMEFIWNRHDHACRSVIAIIFFKKSLDCHHHWVIDNQMICCPIRKMNSAISLYFSYSIKQ